MNTLLKYTLLIAFMLLNFMTYAQKDRITGFWEIVKVNIGEHNMTPIAKWTKINVDGTFQSGNGWLQSSEGSWTYDVESNIFATYDSMGLVDEFGGFKVSFDNENMYWEREENGMPLKVTLKPIEKLPKAPADYLEGLWQLSEITKDGQSILNTFDPENKHRLFIKWDRNYINFSPEDKQLSGYWHINAHKPEVTLLPHQEEAETETWKVEVNEKTLIMVGISESNQNIRREYKRKNSF